MDRNSKINPNYVRSFLTFLGKAVVHEQNSDTWEFGKGALSELRFCGVAVLLCCSRKEVGGRRRNVKGERLRLRLRGWRREEKCQLANNA